MKIDICTIYREIEAHTLIFPIMLDVLNVWSRAAGWETQVRACTEEQIDIETDADAIAFTVYTQNANAVYRVSKKLRDNGKIVILGGPHLRGPNCKEAFPHCDIAVHTINQQQWFNILRDTQTGRIQPNAKTPRYIEDSDNLFDLPSDLFMSFRGHRWYQIPSIFTALGCPYDCGFCNAFQQRRYKTRNIETIYRELEHTNGKVVALSDASFGLDRKFTMELLEALAPLRKSLLVETTMRRLQDDDILDAMAEGGIKAVFMGIESLTMSLVKHGKVRSDLADSVNKVVKSVHDRGMLILGGLIAGLDSDGPDSFDRIYKLYVQSDLDLLFIDMLTPYPNTPLFYEYQRHGRLIDLNWENYDYRHVVFRPRRMSIEQLARGYTSLFRKVTSSDLIYRKTRRMFRRSGVDGPTLAVFAYHLFNRYDARRKQRSFLENLEGMEPGLRASRYAPPPLMLDAVADAMTAARSSSPGHQGSRTASGTRDGARPPRGHPERNR